MGLRTGTGSGPGPGARPAGGPYGTDRADAEPHRPAPALGGRDPPLAGHPRRPSAVVRLEPTVLAGRMAGRDPPRPTADGDYRAARVRRRRRVGARAYEASG